MGSFVYVHVVNTIYLVMYIIVPHFDDHGINIIMQDTHIKS